MQVDSNGFSTYDLMVLAFCQHVRAVQCATTTTTPLPKPFSQKQRSSRLLSLSNSCMMAVVCVWGMQERVGARGGCL